VKPTTDDVELSLRRYLSVAVIDAGRLTHPFRRSTLTQGAVTAAMPVTVSAYPETTGTVREAGRRARKLKQHIEDVATFGLDLGEAARFPGGPPRPRAGPDRIPIYDYEDVALEGSAAERSLPDGAEPIGWLRVEDTGADAIQDPTDPRRWTVIWELRLSWERGGRIPGVPGPVVQSVPQQPPPDDVGPPLF
jgi:hypothetical protein